MRLIALTLCTVAAIVLAPMTAEARGEFIGQMREHLFPGTSVYAVPGAVPLFIFFFVLVSLTVLAFIIFWLLMLADCLKRDWPDKNTWLVILVASLLLSLHWLSAILYYALVKRKNLGAAPSGKPPAVPPAPAV